MAHRLTVFTANHGGLRALASGHAYRPAADGNGGCREDHDR